MKVNRKGLPFRLFHLLILHGYAEFRCCQKQVRPLRMDCEALQVAEVGMNVLYREIQRALQGRVPLVYVQCPEETRALDTLRQLLEEERPGGCLVSWTCTEGLSPGPGELDTRDPVAAIRQIAQRPGEGFTVLHDVTDFFDNPHVVRALRDACRALARTEGRATLFIVSPVRVLPPMLENEICMVEAPLPDGDELQARLARVQACYPGRTISESDRVEMTLALRGLTLDEAEHVLHRVFQSSSESGPNRLDHVFAEKKRLLQKAGFLEYVPTRFEIDDVGGLDILKDWAVKRRGLFTQEALDAGMPIPRGVLIMGVSGCGKSMSAKAIASLWRLPLFRLDMNLVFSGLYGSPEAAFHRALKAIESIAPAVLWIDEIENALGMTSETVSAEQSLTFSSFLTWMQERPPLVFVAATANRIEALPAEAIRKGRFDEVFFCDLPGEQERRDIIRIHLRQNDIDPERIDVDRLLHSTKGWSGAEIGQAVASARVDAQSESRAVAFEDVRRHTTRMVPLSTTMSEQIRAIRSWAYQRATRASRAEARSMIPEA